MPQDLPEKGSGDLSSPSLVRRDNAQQCGEGCRPGPAASKGTVRGSTSEASKSEGDFDNGVSDRKM
jgi:hypothetical protein